MIASLKLVVCLLFLLYACRSDMRTRTVPNELWGVVFVAALPLVIADALAQGAGYLLYTASAVVCMYVFTYTLFRLKVFGGADAKALIALAFIFPAFPLFGLFGCELPLYVPQLGLFAFSVFINAVLLSCFVPVYRCTRVPVADWSVTGLMPRIPFVPLIAAGFVVTLICGSIL